MLNKKLLIVLLVFSLGCVKKVDRTDTNYTYQLSVLKNEYLNVYNILLEKLQTEHIKLEKGVGNFVNFQQLSFFGVSKTAWEDTYSAYLLMGPFTQGNDFFTSNLASKLSYVNLNRMNEGYIDYTSTNPTGGIIGDPLNYPNLYSSDLLNFHQAGGAANVTLGFHAMEFLLWGEDLQANGSGNRSAGEFSNNYLNGERRRIFLRSINEKLKNDLNDSFSEINFVSSIKKLKASESADLLFNSLSKQITYLAEDLIKKALDTQDEFYELDKFSDKTTVHLMKVLEGISFYINPQPLFPSETKYYMIDFISEINPSSARTITDEIENARVNLSLLSNARFDQAISDSQNRTILLSVYNSLISVRQTIDAFLSEIKNN